MIHRVKYFLIFAFCLLNLISRAASLLMPMDETQKNHLKAYGIAFWVLKNGNEVDWLLNYRGGSFMTQYDKKLEDECKIRGVSYEVVADAKVAEILSQVNDPSVNMDLVKLEKAPRIAESERIISNHECRISNIEVLYHSIFSIRVFDIHLFMMIWLTLQNGIGPVQLLHKKQADHLVRESHPRKRKLIIGPVVNRLVKPVRTTDYKNQA